MTLQTQIDFFTQIRSTNLRLEKYIEKLDTLFIQKNISTNKNNKNISKKLTALQVLFNEKALQNKERLKLNFDKIENEREKKFCKINWVVETKKISNLILRFKEVQERGVAFEEENLKLQRMIFSEVEDEKITEGEKEETNIFVSQNKSKGSKNMKKQVKKAEMRKKNLKEIFDNIQILVEILSDLKNHVNENKEVVDFIEVHVEKAEILSKDGAKNLDDALTYQKRIGFLKNLVWGGVGVFVCGIVGIGFLFFLPLVFL
ncbi:hypothetical protein CDIK_1674 [Cucumispora dikerogammari]|nr:hypothetical protein CDIK_1674 [Cucumispora dikerogammari]